MCVVRFFVWLPCFRRASCRIVLSFRPAYLRIGPALRRALPAGATPLMALTATATPNVARDLEAQLELHAAVHVRAPMDRAELYYEVVLADVLLPSGRTPLADLLGRLRGVHHGASGLIYCATRER